VAAGQSQRLYSGVGIFINNATSAVRRYSIGLLVEGKFLREYHYGAVGWRVLCRKRGSGYAGTYPFALQQATPGVFYTCFYNYASRPRLELFFHPELSRSSAGILNHFWIQVAVSELKRPLRIR
jgi:hypothetical protein